MNVVERAGVCLIAATGIFHENRHAQQQKYRMGYKSCTAF